MKSYYLRIFSKSTLLTGPVVTDNVIKMLIEFPKNTGNPGINLGLT